jgi:hypothetical protein
MRTSFCTFSLRKLAIQVCSDHFASVFAKANAKIALNKKIGHGEFIVFADCRPKQSNRSFMINKIAKTDNKALFVEAII